MKKKCIVEGDKSGGFFMQTPGVLPSVQGPPVTQESKEICTIEDGRIRQIGQKNIWEGNLVGEGGKKVLHDLGISISTWSTQIWIERETALFLQQTGCKETIVVYEKPGFFGKIFEWGYKFFTKSEYKEVQKEKALAKGKVFVELTSKGELDRIISEMQQSVSKREASGLISPPDSEISKTTVSQEPKEPVRKAEALQEEKEIKSPESNPPAPFQVPAPKASPPATERPAPASAAAPNVPQQAAVSKAPVPAPVPAPARPDLSLAAAPAKPAPPPPLAAAPKSPSQAGASKVPPPVASQAQISDRSSVSISPLPGEKPAQVQGAPAPAAAPKAPLAGAVLRAPPPTTERPAPASAAEPNVPQQVAVSKAPAAAPAPARPDLSPAAAPAKPAPPPPLAAAPKALTPAAASKFPSQAGASKAPPPVASKAPIPDRSSVSISLLPGEKPAQVQGAPAPAAAPKAPLAGAVLRAPPPTTERPAPASAAEPNVPQQAAVSKAPVPAPAPARPALSPAAAPAKPAPARPDLPLAAAPAKPAPPPPLAAASKEPLAGAVSRAPVQDQVQDRPSAPSINAIDRRRSRRRDQDTRSWEEELTPKEVQRVREARDRERTFLQVEIAKEAAQKVLSVPSVSPTAEDKIAVAEVQEVQPSDKAANEIKTPLHPSVPVSKISTVARNPVPGGQKIKFGGLPPPPPLPPLPGERPTQVQGAPAPAAARKAPAPAAVPKAPAPAAVRKAPAPAAVPKAPPRVATPKAPLPVASQDQTPGRPSVSSPSLPGTMPAQAPIPVLSKNAEMEQQLVAVLREGFAEDAAMIAKVALQAFPEMGQDQGMSGSTKKASACGRMNVYSIKYRFRKGIPELVVGQEMGRGSFKVVKKVYSISIRTLQLNQATAYAKLLGSSRSRAQEMQREAFVSQKIATGLLPGEIPKFVQMREVCKIKNPSVVKGIMMELCSGDTTRVTQNFSKFSLKERLTLARDEAEGIAQMHRSGVIHCDIKPANVLLKRVSDGLRALISDFGTSVMAGKIMGSGSPLYMAPEVIKNPKIPAKEARDLWALGFCIFELMYGESNNPFCKIQKEEDLVPSSSRWKVAYEELMKALAKPNPINNLLRSLFDMNPKKRPSAADVKVALDSMLAGM